MSFAQRLAQVRRDNHLSQEAFGDALGVSRQAISKWESGVSLPEVEKLIAIAKIYRVSIAWLLDVEEAAEKQAPEQGELTPAQLQMVEEIVSRYLAALPKKKVRSQGSKNAIFLGVGLGILVLLISGGKLSRRLDRMSSDYMTLRDNVSQISRNVSQEMSGLTGRVEEILKSQNDLTADYAFTRDKMDLAANTVTYSLRATPKTYQEGMTAVFSVESGGKTRQEVGKEEENHNFSAQITCPLSDEIRLGVAFETRGVTQSQLLGQETFLDRDSRLQINGDCANLWGEEVVEGRLSLDKWTAFLNIEPPFSVEPEAMALTAKNVAVGVFVNAQLIATQDFQPDASGDSDERDRSGQVLFDDVVLTLKPGDSVVIAATVTDSYARKSTGFLDCFTLSRESRMEHSAPPADSAAYEVP